MLMLVFFPLRKWLLSKIYTKDFPLEHKFLLIITYYFIDQTVTEYQLNTGLCENCKSEWNLLVNSNTKETKNHTLETKLSRKL